MPSNPAGTSSTSGTPSVKRRAAWFHYAAAVTMVGLACALRESFTPIWGPTSVPYLFFWPAVVLAAWYGRTGPGIVALALSAFVGDWLFIEPRYELLPRNLRDSFECIVFIGVGFSVILVVEAMHRAQVRARAALLDRERLTVDLERLVAERTSQIEEKATRLAEAETIAKLGSWDWDALGNVVRWSDELYRIYGLTRESFRGSFEGFLERVHPEDRERVRETVKSTAHEGETLEMVYRIVRPDGATRILRARGQVLRNASGQTVRMYGTSQDMTEEKEREERERIRRAIEESEARLAMALEQLPLGVGVADREGRWSISNEIMRRYIPGVIPARDPSRISRWRAFREDGSLVPPEDWPTARALRGDRVLPGLEMLFTTDDGSKIWVRMSSVPLREIGGAIIGAISTVEDIDALKRAEVILRESEERLASLNTELELRVKERTRQLQETVQELQSFSYTVAHDLRAPLRAMQGFADLVLEDAGPRLEPVEREYLGRITQASRRMDNLVRDLLSYSRLGLSAVKPEPVDLDALVREVLWSMHADLEARKAETVVEAGIPVVVAQRAILFEVLTNLISNAVKFVAPGVAPRIRIAAQTRDDHVRLLVEDHGIGVDPRFHDKLFGVFERLHDANAYPGTGIGLAIVKRGIERMGGRVGVESQVGKGSMFWFELPAAPQAPSRSAGAGIPRSDPSKGT